MYKVFYSHLTKIDHYCQIGWSFKLTLFLYLQKGSLNISLVPQEQSLASLCSHQTVCGCSNCFHLHANYLHCNHLHSEHLDYLDDKPAFNSLHKKWSFPLRIFSVNVTKSQETADLVNFFCAVTFSFTKHSYYSGVARSHCLSITQIPVLYNVSLTNIRNGVKQNTGVYLRHSYVVINFQRRDWLKSEADNKVEWPCNMSATK